MFESGPEKLYASIEQCKTSEIHWSTPQRWKNGKIERAPGWGAIDSA
jgi:hypothetical protein